MGLAAVLDRDKHDAVRPSGRKLFSAICHRPGRIRSRVTLIAGESVHLWRRFFHCSRSRIGAVSQDWPPRGLVFGLLFQFEQRV
jgi:hypothetical protein